MYNVYHSLKRKNSSKNLIYCDGSKILRWATFLFNNSEKKKKERRSELINYYCNYFCSIQQQQKLHDDEFFSFTVVWRSLETTFSNEFPFQLSIQSSSSSSIDYFLLFLHQDRDIFFSFFFTTHSQQHKNPLGHSSPNTTSDWPQTESP